MKDSVKVIFALILFFTLLLPYQANSQSWSKRRVESLGDSSFAAIEITENQKKLRHFAYRDNSGQIDIDQLIYCLGIFGEETWLKTETKDTARKKLEEHYYRFKLKQAKEDIEEPIDINKAVLKELVRLPNIGPVTAVKIYQFRDKAGPFERVEDVKKVEGIGNAIFTGIRYYIRVK